MSERIWPTAIAWSSTHARWKSDVQLLVEPLRRLIGSSTQIKSAAESRQERAAAPPTQSSGEVGTAAKFDGPTLQRISKELAIEICPIAEVVASGPQPRAIRQKRFVSRSQRKSNRRNNGNVSAKSNCGSLDTNSNGSDQRQGRTEDSIRARPRRRASCKIGTRSAAIITAVQKFGCSSHSNRFHRIGISCRCEFSKRIVRAK